MQYQSNNKGRIRLFTCGPIQPRCPNPPKSYNGDRPESSKVSESKEVSESIRFTQGGGPMAPFQTLERSIDQKCGLAKAWLIIK